MILYHARFEIEIQKHVFTLQSGKNSACKNFSYVRSSEVD